MTRGSLRVYLGAAPGVGKTFAMLGEGRRRAERGTDVVVGFVEAHGRSRTGAELGALPVVPRRRILHDGVELEEMDLDAVLTRRPQVVLVDELAHTNAPGSRHAKRYQDVEELLRAGIHVITTVNIQHLESLYDEVVNGFDVLHVHGRDDVDALAQQLLDVLVALGVPAARRVGVGQLVHEGHGRTASQ